MPTTQSPVETAPAGPPPAMHPMDPSRSQDLSPKFVALLCWLLALRPMTEPAITGVAVSGECVFAATTEDPFYNALIGSWSDLEATPDHTPAYPREICIRALEHNASALIVVHQHPGGDPTPSGSDIDMTGRIRDALRTIDVSLHDHIIVTSTAAVSFKDKGLF